MNNECFKLKAQLTILKHVRKDYPYRTIENIIQNIEAKIECLNKYNDGTNHLL